MKSFSVTNIVRSKPSAIQILTTPYNNLFLKLHNVTPSMVRVSKRLFYAVGIIMTVLLCNRSINEGNSHVAAGK